MEEEIKTKGNADIEEALKEFEMKSGASATQTDNVINQTNPQTSKKEVSGIQFETESYAGVKYYQETKTPKIIKWVMKSSGGAIKEEKHAEYILFGFVLLIFGVSLYLFFSGGDNRPGPSAQDLLTTPQSVVLPK